MSEVEGLGRALAERYFIERELGRGGYSVVYLARDLKHDRQVALKVLQPELALAVRAERFLREIQIAAKLTHPHILALHDSGEVDGIPYYVMPYVEGESLRDRLNREKQLPVEDALKVTRDVAAALTYAHEQGVVHRDVKPENILLSHGEALVADFGIARALTVAGGQTVTEAGIAVGTPAYMSPEQAGASGEPDARSDIYSLGCVLYEMLAGHAPFTGATAQEILARQTLDPVPSLKAARDAVPDALEQVVRKALAKQPADRFAGARQFLDALSAGSLSRPTAPRRTAAVAAITLVVLGLVPLVWRRVASAAHTSEQSVAVLPCLNLSTDPDNEYFSDGMTEELINSLAQVEGLRVPARTSSFVFKGKPVDIREVGQKLDVAHVVECSARRAGGLLRVTAQLIKVSDGYHVWSQDFERELRDARDVFAVQDSISHAVVAALRVKLATGAPPVTPRYTPNLETYELYLKGRHFWNQRTDERMLKAVDYFTAAIARDSGYAAAYSGLSDAYYLLSTGGGDWRDLYPKAKQAANRALLLDDRLAEAHVSLARLLHANFVVPDFPAAEVEYRKAIALNPNYALAHGWLGWMLRQAERVDEAIAEGEQGQRLDPLSPTVNFELGRSLAAAGRYDEAIRYFNTAIELQPDWRTPHINVGDAYLQKGMFPQAIAAFQRLTTLSTSTPYDLALLGRAYVLAGDRAQAEKIRDQLLEKSRTGKGFWQPLAVISTWLGDKDHAFEYLERARRAGGAFPNVRVNSVWNPIRSDPRFDEFVKRLGQDD